MAKPTIITRPLLAALRVEIVDALTVALKERGLTVDVGAIKFTATDARVQVLLSAGNKEEVRRRQFGENAPAMGFAPSDYGREFTSATSGQRFRVVGFKPSAVKYPVVAERVSDGRAYKFPLKAVRDALAPKRRDTDVLAEVFPAGSPRHRAAFKAATGVDVDTARALKGGAR